MAKKKANPDQDELYPQKRIPEIESAIIACDKKQAQIDEVMELLDGDGDKQPGLKAELKDLEKGLRRALHANEEKIDRQQSADELPVLLYQRGDYRAEVKAHERLSYDKVRQSEQES